MCLDSLCIWLSHRLSHTVEMESPLRVEESAVETEAVPVCGMLSSGSACRGEGGQKRSPKTKLIPETFGTNWGRENTWTEFSKGEKYRE